MMLQNRSTTKHIKHKTYKLTLNFELKITEKTFKISESFWKPCLHQMQDYIFGGKFDILTLLAN